MSSVHSRPIIESDGNNLALRRAIRLLKKLITKVTDIIIEGGLVAEELLDAIGSAVVQVLGLIGYPLTYLFTMPEIFKVFTGKPLPMSLPLIFVLHIILLIYSTYVLCYMPAVGMSFLSTESISFHVITALAIISYYRGVTTDPGSIPPTPEWEKDNVSKKQEGLRFCSREKKYKPDRTHYCSAIGRNVLKMDHYCPWLANCVGYFNHKFFLLFIVYASISTCWTTVSVAHLLAVSSAGLLTKANALSAAQVFFLTEGLCISSLISLILTPFTGFHLWLVANNKTTLEYCEKANSSVSYDFGIGFNFCQVFGYNPLFWFLPIQTVAGEGLVFDRRAVDPPSESVPVLAEESEDDESETKIRKELEAKVGIVSDPPGVAGRRGCCIRRWDVAPSSDSPLLGDEKSDGGLWDLFLCKCLEVNSFRSRLHTGFSNIVSGRDTPVDTTPGDTRVVTPDLIRDDRVTPTDPVIRTGDVTASPV